MANAFRLKSSTMFDRIDDEIKEQRIINQAKQLEHDVDKLIGNDGSASEKMGDIGSNIFELFELLRE